MTKNEKINKLGNAIRRYRGIGRPTKVAGEVVMQWTQTPKPKEWDSVLEWANQLIPSCSGHFLKIQVDNFKSVQEFNKWMASLWATKSNTPYHQSPKTSTHASLRPGNHQSARSLPTLELLFTNAKDTTARVWCFRRCSVRLVSQPGARHARLAFLASHICLALATTANDADMPFVTSISGRLKPNAKCKNAWKKRGKTCINEVESNKNCSNHRSKNDLVESTGKKSRTCVE